jgi:16S rRNA (cytosine1402-N4)-methyltransferase
VCGGRKVLKLLTKKPLMPDEDEIRDNPASRSARLRCALKLKETAGADSREEGEKITA